MLQVLMMLQNKDRQITIIIIITQLYRVHQ